MLGLALGGLVVGRWADRVGRPLALYALLEAGIGLYAALTPWLYDWLQRLYTALASPETLGSAGGHVTRVLMALGALKHFF